MKKRSYLLPALLCVGCCSFCSSCVQVKPYQKMYINDAEMDLNPKKIEKTEISFESYREGASGANGGKSGGGCGCN